MFIAYRLRRVITNKLVDNKAEKFSLASLVIYRACLRSQILCKVK